MLFEFIQNPYLQHTHVCDVPYRYSLERLLDRRDVVGRHLRHDGPSSVHRHEVLLLHHRGYSLLHHRVLRILQLRSSVDNFNNNSRGCCFAGLLKILLDFVKKN